MLNFELFAATHAMTNCSIVNFSYPNNLTLNTMPTAMLNFELFGRELTGNYITN